MDRKATILVQFKNRLESKYGSIRQTTWNRVYENLFNKEIVTQAVSNLSF